MALMKCPECGKQVSTNAEVCPHCGNPLKEKTIKSVYKENKEPVDTSWLNEYNQKRKSALTFSIILGLILTGGAIGCFIGGFKSDSYENPGTFRALIIVGFFMIVFGLVLLLSCVNSYKVNTRTVDGYTIMVYNGIKTIVTVDGKVVCTGGAFKRSLYADLPNGRHITVKISAWDSSATISIDN